MDSPALQCHCRHPPMYYEPPPPSVLSYSVPHPPHIHPALLPPARPPPPPVTHFVYSDQSTSTTDGLYASLHSSNVTASTASEFSDFNEEESVNDPLRDNVQRRIIRARRPRRKKYFTHRRLRLYFIIIAFMFCFYAAVVVALGLVIHFHHHSSTLLDEETSSVTGTANALPPGYGEFGVIAAKLQGKITDCVAQNATKGHPTNNCTWEILEMLLKSVMRNGETAEFNRKQLTLMNATLNEQRNKATIVHLIGGKDLTWEIDTHQNPIGDVKYDKTQRCLTVSEGGHFFVYSQVCVRLLLPGTYTHTMDRGSRNDWVTFLSREMFVEGNSGGDTPHCTASLLSGVVFLRPGQSVKVGLTHGVQQKMTYIEKYNTFGLFRLL